MVLHPCAQAEETFEHVLTCPLPSTRAHRDASLKQLEIALTAILPTPLLRVILHGLSNWVNPSNSGYILTSNLRLHCWYRYGLGRVSKKRASAIQLFKQTQPGHSNPKYTISLMINHIWQFLTAMWTHRNTIVHGATVQRNRLLVSFIPYMTNFVNITSNSMMTAYVLTRHHYLFTSRTLDQSFL